MTVKAAQARINLANIIENQLGYPIHKTSSVKINQTNDEQYSPQGQQQLPYQVKAEATLLDRAHTRQEIQLIKARKYRNHYGNGDSVLPDVTGQQRQISIG